MDNNCDKKIISELILCKFFARFCPAVALGMVSSYKKITVAMLNAKNPFLNALKDIHPKSTFKN